MTYDSVCRQTVTVNLESGLHLVPCSQIAQFARSYDCDVQISKDDLTVDAKNVLDLVTLKATHGTTLVLEAAGDGAAEVVEGLVNLFESNFES
jgi:phosphotransferase system HPr (HPr) family protein